MLITQAELEEMKNRYPDDKPSVFNYTQAREDLLRLVEAYSTLLNRSNSTGQITSPSHSDKKAFIVLIDSDYVRDTQILPSNHYETDEDEDGNLIDREAEWEDFQAEVLLGMFDAYNSEEAINNASQRIDIHPYKLVAYQIAN